jgi:hypothetical protein
MIQVEQPINCPIKLFCDVKNLEMFNAATLGKLDAAKSNWALVGN